MARSKRNWHISIDSVGKNPPEIRIRARDARAAEEAKNYLLSLSGQVLNGSLADSIVVRVVLIDGKPAPVNSYFTLRELGPILTETAKAFSQ